jgi:universal stress protein A
MIAKTRSLRRVRTATDRHSLQIGKILVPVDFSPASKRAFNYALRFTKDFGSELTLLFVLEPAASPNFTELAARSSFSELELSRAEKNLRALLLAARSAGVTHARSILRHGPASHEIVEAAKHLDADLIVIATHGYTSWKHFCIGSTAERVVRAAPCPVLVVRDKEHEFV